MLKINKTKTLRLLLSYKEKQRSMKDNCKESFFVEIQRIEITNYFKNLFNKLFSFKMITTKLKENNKILVFLYKADYFIEETEWKVLNRLINKLLKYKWNWIKKVHLKNYGFLKKQTESFDVSIVRKKVKEALLGEEWVYLPPILKSKRKIVHNIVKKYNHLIKKSTTLNENKVIKIRKKPEK
ncbi:hypothetical protein SAPIS_v1c09980 [Spiroplasma apis B31]|uniref:R3H domain-containing protein n=1 Tax=Spiroplasma apis B31 TaxID=1276258 RepID=V5RK38_SPIAP|nr:hypothetical protein SAPIS_v1c09980 [Spiroplasma apis B31]